MCDTFCVDALFSGTDFAPHSPTILMMAERELAAFYQAVLTMYGPKVAWEAAGDWIKELEAVSYEKPIRWHQISLVAADRLADRLPGVIRAPALEPLRSVYIGPDEDMS